MSLNLSKRCIWNVSIKHLRKLCKGTLVTAQQIDEYQENGVVCLRGVFDRKWLDMTVKAIEKTVLSPSRYHDAIRDENSRLFFNDYYNFDRFTEYLDFVNNSPAAEISGKLMKSSVSTDIISL